MPPPLADSSPVPERSESAPPREIAPGSGGELDLRELFLRVGRGANQIVGFALLGLVAAAISSLALSRLQPGSTTTRVVFSFDGFERGEYPDKSKFQADDLRAPAVVAEALHRMGLDTSSDFQSKIRGALTIEGVIPADVVKVRDRLRAAGQNAPAYQPDEYALTLSLPRSFPLGAAQRNRLLGEIVSAYRENFRRTYGQPPLSFGTAFETLQNADFPEYELVLNAEVDNIRAYLTQQADAAKAFRSPTTNFTFADLQEQTNLFAQVQLNETLGLIHQNGLSRNRTVALMKMDYYLKLLEDRERKAAQNEGVVRDLLAQSQARSQNYVLGIKSQAAQPKGETPILDQGLIDSLLANDSNNFLVRRALDAGLEVKRIQAEKARLIEVRDNLKSFNQASEQDQTAIMAEANRSLKSLQAAYDKLVDNIRKTQADYANQQFGDAIRLSDQVRTAGVLRPLAVAGIVGGCLGGALGVGLSLLGVYLGRRQMASA